MLTIFILSFVGALIAAVVGTVWYSGATPMGKVHMQYLGFDTLSETEMAKIIAEAKPKMPKIYAAQIALSCLTAFFTVFVVTMSVQNGVSAGMAILFPIMGWLCFTVPTVGSALLWSNSDPSIVWKKFFSDIFSSLVTILLIATMTVMTL